MVRELKTKAEFDAALANAGGKLVAIDFAASWCPPCRMIGPKFVALSEMAEYANVEFYKVDVDVNNETAAAQGVSAMPTFKFYKDGKQVGEVVGADEQQLKAALNQHK